MHVILFAGAPLIFILYLTIFIKIMFCNCIYTINVLCTYVHQSSARAGFCRPGHDPHGWEFGPVSARFQTEILISGQARPGPNNFFSISGRTASDFKTSPSSYLDIINVLIAADLFFDILLKQPIQYCLLSAIFHEKNIMLQTYKK